VTPSNLCFRAAMLLVLVGMVWGLQMAITDDHSAFPAHAHLNLLGFVALFLFGVFYRLNPTVEANRLAIPQVLIWIVSTVVTAIGVGLVHTGHPAGDPIAAVGSFAIFGDAILFTWLVFQAHPPRIVPLGSPFVSIEPIAIGTRDRNSKACGNIGRRCGRIQPTCRRG
jgi:uncharacterized protein YhhL (DUF1145 family)